MEYKIFKIFKLLRLIIARIRKMYEQEKSGIDSGEDTKNSTAAVKASSDDTDFIRLCESVTAK